MSTYSILTRSDFDSLIVAGVNDVRRGEKKIGTALHDAIRACLFRGELDRLNSLTLACSKLALYSVIAKAIKILSGGSYTTADGTRYYKEESSILRYDTKAQTWNFLDNRAERLQKVQADYADFAALELRNITAKTPELPLTLEPIRKYIQKLTASGSKWDDRERETIKTFLNLTNGLFGAPEQTNGENICAAQTSGLDGKPQAPTSKKARKTA